MMAKHHAWESKLLPGYTGFAIILTRRPTPYLSNGQFSHGKVVGLICSFCFQGMRLNWKLEAPAKDMNPYLTLKDITHILCQWTCSVFPVNFSSQTPHYHILTTPLSPLLALFPQIYPIVPIFNVLSLGFYCVSQKLYGLIVLSQVMHSQNKSC